MIVTIINAAMESGLRITHSDPDRVVPLDLSGVLHPQGDRVQEARTRSAQLDYVCFRRTRLTCMDKRTAVNDCDDHQCGDGKWDDCPGGNSLTSSAQPHDSTSNVP